MKKFIGPICSFVAGIFTFIFLSIANFVVTVSYLGFSASESSTAWDMIKESADVKGYGLFKVSTIFLIILACLLIVSGVILLLKNLGILKVKINFSIINNIILSAFAFFAVLALIGLFIMGGEVSVAEEGIKMTATAGVGAWLNVILGAAACALAWIFARKDA